LRIDDHRARHGFDLVELADLAVHVEGNREGDGLGQLAQPRLGVLGIRLDIHAEHGEAHGLVLLVDVLEQRHFVAAGFAPAGPEIDHDDLALELGKVHRLAAAGG
jgi:hypothetical protein